MDLFLGSKGEKEKKRETIPVEAIRNFIVVVIILLVSFISLLSVLLIQREEKLGFFIFLLGALYIAYIITVFIVSLCCVSIFKKTWLAITIILLGQAVLLPAFISTLKVNPFYRLLEQKEICDTCSDQKFCIFVRDARQNPLYY